MTTAIETLNINKVLNSPLEYITDSTIIRAHITTANITQYLSNFNDNINIGSGALPNWNNGYRNIAIGTNALVNDTSGHRNIAIGYSSLSSNTGGHRNIAVGNATLVLNTTGYQNVGVGDGVLYSNNGSFNTAVGFRSLCLDTSGIFNTAIGASSGININGGSSNTFLGNYSGNSILTGNNNLCIGAGADTGSDISNGIIIGNNGNNSCTINCTTDSNTPVLLFPHANVDTNFLLPGSTGWMHIKLGGSFYRIPLY